MTFEEFTGARLPALLRYAVMLTGDPHLAQDIVQETMVRAHVKWHRVQRADDPERYVKRMLTNEYVTWRRRSWFRRTVLRSDVDDRRVTPNHADATVERDAMWELLATLPPRQRAAIVLRYYEGLSDTAIAQVMDCTVGTVRGHISRALATLRSRPEPRQARPSHPATTPAIARSQQ